MTKKKKINYVIFATPRTGSTMLCNILENLGLLSSVYNNNNYELKFKLKKNIFKDTKPDIFFNELLEKNRINNISGFKFMIKHLEIYGKSSNYSLEYLLNSFPKGTKFIWIKRKNKLRQAISFLRARQSKRWLIQKRNNKNDETEYTISNKKIDSIIEQWIKDGHRFEKVLKKNDIKPLTLYYEDFKDDQTKTIREILRFLEIKIKNPVIKTNLIRQSDSITKDIVANYKGIFSKNKFYQEMFFLRKGIMNKIYVISACLRKKYLPMEKHLIR